MNAADMEKINNIVSRLSLSRKAGLCSGRGNWFFRGIESENIKEITVCDGPHGLRKMTEDGKLEELEASVPATCFPTAAALASSWDRDLISEVGEAIAGEAAAERVSIVLGPGANIKRSPLCGRNFEYFSEDPLLSGELASAMIKGIQDRGIGSSLKHFAVNNQERLRMSIDAVVDERTLREIYLSGFERAVKNAAPWTVMCAYNRLNGEYLSDNSYILDDILRKEWGFDGIVISDWGACNDRVEALRAGMEIEMPYSGRHNIEAIAKAVESGRLSGKILDRAAARITGIMLRAGATLEKTEKEPAVFDAQANHEKARTAAAESIVLLKNDNAVLPISENERLLVAGEFAVHPRYQGAGSSRINPTRINTFLEEIRKIYPETAYCQGYSPAADTDMVLQNRLIAEAVGAAASADRIIVLAGLPDNYESEGFDRTDMKMPDSHNALIEALISTGKPVIVCLSNGAPVEMPWNGRAAAVVECYLGGQAGAAALADVLTGTVNPSGKLAESFPLKLEDTPSFRWFPGDQYHVEYREGIYVGYRYYDTAAKPVLYPFGHGLSYTEFEYSGLRLSRDHAEAAEKNSFEINVSLKIKNTGGRTGKEAVQLYIGNPQKRPDNPNNTPHRPVKELAGFTKIELSPEEEKEVVFRLDFRSFACYSPSDGDWILPAGSYKIMAGTSSADIRLSAEIRIDDGVIPRTADTDYDLIGTDPDIIHRISDKSFEAELGRPLPAEPEQKEWDRSSTLTDFSSTLIGKIILGIGLRMSAGFSENNENSAGMYEAMAREMPLRALAQLSGGIINMEMVDAFILLGNRRPFRGIAALIGALIKLVRERKLD